MQLRGNRGHAIYRGAVLASLMILSTGAASAEQTNQFIPRLINSSTIPSNGDLNPYGVAFVPEGFPAGGRIATGNVLVSNFNDSANSQGRGTTIIKLSLNGSVAPPGAAVTFYTSPRPGLSTALGVLRAGLVLVGNLPTSDGTFGTIGQGALQVIDRNGHLLQSLTDATFLDGPWDLAIVDRGTQAQVFVSNVRNGTVSRLDVAVHSGGLTVLRKATVANGYTHQPNAAALILGPTGLAVDLETDTLYVASTADNAIYAVSQASSRTTPLHRGSLIFADSHLRGPLALKFAPNGHLLTANGDAVNADVSHPSEIVEFTKSGEFAAEYDVDASQVEHSDSIQLPAERSSITPLSTT
jgi:hypothetical protein